MPLLRAIPTILSIGGGIVFLEIFMFKRIGNSVAAIPFGILLLIASFPLLFWNEGRAVKTARALAEGSKKVITIDAGNVNPDFEGQLVHLSGKANTAETLTDSQFGVSTNAIKLRRNVEMYQWKEKSSSSNNNKNKTYSYDKVWSKSVISSSSFNNQSYSNPSSMPFQTSILQANNVSLDAFVLPSSLISKINNYTAIVPDSSLLASLKANPSFANLNLEQQGQQLFIGYKGSSVNPEIGDVRVSFEQVLPGPVSVIAQQDGNSFTAFKAKSGRNLSMLRVGSLTADEMFTLAVKENNMLTWAMRFLGFFLMLGAFRIILGPLEAMTSMIPLLGPMVRMGLSAVSFALAFALTLVTVAISWFTFRPLISIPLLVLALAGIFIVWQMGRKKEPVVVRDAATV